MENQHLNSIKCRGILDTRKLQEFRIHAIGKESYSERTVKYNSPKLYDSNPNLFSTLSDSELRYFYGLSIPMTYPSGSSPYDWGIKSEGYNTDCSRFYDDSCFSRGAVHLTTNEGLNKILEIVKNKGIKIELGKTRCGLFDLFDKKESIDASKKTEPATITPHDWYSGCMEYSPSMLNLAFVVLEQELHSLAYYTRTQTTIKEEFSIGTLGDDISEKIVQTNRLECKPTYYCPDHYRKPEDYLPEIIEANLEAFRKRFESNKRTKKDNRRISCGRKEPNRELVDSSACLVELGNPSTLYNPEWIKL